MVWGWETGSGTDGGVGDAMDVVNTELGVDVGEDCAVVASSISSCRAVRSLKTV